ncbi:MAG TPA: ABC transporter permease [candidate division Zixibacteria bacterium]|jgi:ribose transport system permease protein|nr:ABC transporter permease [Candidatus Latescibacterota bacterium]MDP7235404.1 ABC transporter permease [Candidatus Latescibacterota bacterium]HIG46115.1 ABC transporter permease [candidate division Zixibacteria bacterium]
MLRTLLNSQQAGLLFVILLIGTILSLSAGDHVNRVTGEVVNNFLNSYTLMQTATDASFFVIMAVGATVVIISGGIDLSVGAVYALAGVMTAMMLRAVGPESAFVAVVLSLGMCVGIGVLCGLINGAMVVGLRVHPFIVTLGTMWIYRGVAFVTSKAESILVPPSLTDVVKWSISGDALYPMPMIIMLIITAAGAIYLSRTVMGRHIFAVGGNVDASRYAGLRINRILIGVYILSGLTAGIAAFVGISYYGSASCADATGYELYVIASAVVGGASLRGGRGNAVNAMLGATLIVLIRQSIRTLHLDQNYEWIIIGCAIIVAVVLDQINQHFTTRRLAKEA